VRFVGRADEAAEEVRENRELRHAVRRRRGQDHQSADQSPVDGGSSSIVYRVGISTESRRVNSSIAGAATQVDLLPRVPSNQGRKVSNAGHGENSRLRR